MFRELIILVFCGALASPGCGDDGGKTVTDDTAISQLARVKFKGNDRLLNDFAQALGLEKDEVCNEFGQYSCTHLVHQVPLGGTAAYAQGLFEPIEEATVTGPMAADRLALSACTLRVDRDITENPLIFADLAINADGTLASIDDPVVDTAIDTLYKRALQRPPTAAEIGHLEDLYRDIEARGGDKAARDWAVLSCFAVMTSLEQLYY